MEIKDWIQRHFYNLEAASLVCWLALGTLFIYLAGRLAEPLLLSLISSYLMHLAAHKTASTLHLSYTWAALLTHLSFWGLLLCAGVYLLPLCINQLYHLAQSLPDLLCFCKTLLVKISASLPSNLMSALPPTVNVPWPWQQQLVNWLATLSSNSISILLTSLQSLGALCGHLLIIMLLSFFMLRDYQSLLTWLGQFWPTNRPQLQCLWMAIMRDLVGYLRSKLCEAILVIAASLLLFSLFDLHYSLLLSVCLGISVFIPYVGIICISIPVIIIALLQWGCTSYSAIFIAIYLLLNLLEGQLLAPMLMAKLLALHPLAVLLALLCCSYWFGFCGALLALPLLIFLRLLLVHWPTEPSSSPRDRPSTR